MSVEIGLLPVLAAALTVAVPVPSFVGGEADRRFTISDRIAGRALTDDLVGERTAADVAGALSELHAISVERLDAIGLARFDAERWRSAYARFAGDITSSAVARRDHDVSRRIASAIDAFVARDELFVFDPTLVHADLGEQIFVDASSGRVTGIIDWADSLVGDPALDIGALAEYGSAFVESVLAGYRGSPDATMLERARFYDALSPVVGYLGAVELGLDRNAEICWDETTSLWG